MTSTCRVKDVVCPADFGKLIIAKSDKFGTHEFLIAKYPKKYFEDQCIFIDTKTGNVLFWDSVCNDEFQSIRTWEMR